jgi:hypothetical protein
MKTRRWLLAAQLALLALPRQAAAADRVQECIGEHVEAQLLRKQGRLVEARARLLECAQTTCPALVRDECAVLGREVEAALPSVVLGAVDADGQPTSEPMVSIDGSWELVPLDGGSLRLDPGEHRLRFQHPDGTLRDVELVLAESEHDRRVVADFRSTPASGGARGERRWPSSVLLVSAGVATAALGSFTYFALSGRSVQDDLEQCKPNCENRADIDRMRSRYLIADISLGLALVSLGVGAYAWTQRSSAPSPDRSQGEAAASRERANRTGLQLQPIATARSVGLWASGEF